MFGHIRALFILSLLVVNTLVLTSILFFLWFVQLFIPSKTIKQILMKKVRKLPLLWVGTNQIIFKYLLPCHFKVTGAKDLNPQHWYLLISNHRTWADILVLQNSLHNLVPSLRFFMKEELKWQLPIAAQACQILGFPFVKRYSKEFLKKHPEYQGKDVIATQKTLNRFKDMPSSIINFAEGHRFTQKRHQKQHSPYQHLLKPKAGGIAFALAALAQHVDEILNLTILYPEKNLTFWEFLSGKVAMVELHIERITITPELIGDYQNDHDFRIHFQKWLNQLWQEKDISLIQHFQNKKKISVKPNNSSILETSNH